MFDISDFGSGSSGIINEEDIDVAVDMLFNKLVEAKIITR